MKKRTKKIQAQVEFVTKLQLHPSFFDSEEIKKLIKDTKDEELPGLVDRFYHAYLDLQEKAEEMKQALAAYLVDDSDF